MHEYINFLGKDEKKSFTFGFIIYFFIYVLNVPYGDIFPSIFVYSDIRCQDIVQNQGEIKAHKNTPF